jgi:hypothetical protein
MIRMNLIWSPGIKGKEYVGLHSPYRMYQLPAQSKINLYFTIVITEKRYLAHPQRFGSAPLFLFPYFPQSLHRHTSLVAAPITACHQYIVNVPALGHQSSYSTSANKLGIIRVCHNHENALTSWR